MFLLESDKFRENPEELTVTVVGAGYVGVSLAAIFAESGVKVWVLDVDKEKVKTLNDDKLPFYEPGIDNIFVKHIHKNLFVTGNIDEAISESDVILVSVGTPLNVFQEPSIVNVTNACKDIAKSISKGSILILCSTVPVGTTSDVIKPLIEKISGYKVDEEVGLAFCPERLMEGSAVTNLRDMVKLIGAVGEKSKNATSVFFDIVRVKSKSVSTPEVAEMAKLLCNAYRAANIALGNEFSLICESFGINAHEVVEASNTSPIVNIMRPGMMGGSCLTKDPYFLTTSAMKKGIHPEILVSAKNLNEELPRYVARLVVDGFKEAKKSIMDSKIAILGFAFKGETDDIRETPVIPLIETLKKVGVKEMVVYDPYVKKESILSLNVDVAESIPGAIKNTDCIIFGTDHNEIKNLNFEEVIGGMKNPPILIDGKGILKYRIDDKIIQKGIGLC